MPPSSAEGSSGGAPIPVERIAQRVAPGASVATRSKLRGGVSAHVESLELLLPSGERRCVVVRQPGDAARNGADARTAQRELALLGALFRAGLPVPEPLFVDEDAGPPCLVMAFVAGTAERDAAALPGALRRMAAFLARLHALDIASLPPLPPREDPIAGALAFLPATPEHAAFRTALASHPLEARNAAALLHGDFWPGNVLWDGDEIAAVLDWEDAAIGDPLCDLAGARVELTWRHGEEAADTFTAAYLSKKPIELADLPVWEFFVASAGAASMGEWGLAPEDEARMRRRTARILTRAGDAVLQRRGSVPSGS